jgi:hypothetical protein
MSNLVIFFIHLLATVARLLDPGGVRSIVAESLVLKHQLLIVARSRQRSPNLCTSDRILAGLMALLVRPTGTNAKSARCASFGGLKNGELLDAAEAAGFDVLVTLDRGFRYEQNLAGRKIAVVIFRTKSIALKDLLPHAPEAWSHCNQ